MVVFTCNHCGESLHKPKVEKHYQFTCRNFKSVTCVDCFKDFRNEEYVAHTKCITEDERYAAKGTYTNGIVKKGDVKQESWVEMIKSICNTEKTLKPSLRNLLNTISEYNNVPRKKQKFLNFIKSSSGNRANIKEVEEVWDIIEKYKEKSHANNQDNQKNINNRSENTNKENTNGITKSDHQGKKRSMEDNEITEKESLKKKKKKSVEETAEENKQDNVEDIKKKVKKRKKETLENFNEGSQNGHPEILDNSKKKKNKAKNKDVDVEESVQSAEAVEEQVETPKFDFKEKIIEILTEKKRISLSKLQKKVVKAYVRTVGESDCEDKVIKKFNKKLKKIDNVGIEDDRVVLHQ